LAKEPGEAAETHGPGAETDLVPLDFAAYLDDVHRRILGAYAEGGGSTDLPADFGLARLLIPLGTHVSETSSPTSLSRVTSAPSSDLMARPLLGRPGAVRVHTFLGTFSVSVALIT
jgi:hypothetical protein